MTARSPRHQRPRLVWREDRPLSSLDGVPITIKDIIATKGVPVPIGTAAADFTPAAEDQPPAARIREAGCVILGKTTMPDFGMLASGVSSLHGITRNPWNTERNTSGSSSGAGAAIAAGYVLEKAVETRDSLLVFIKEEPALEALHSHPRWKALLRPMNFPE